MKLLQVIILYNLKELCFIVRIINHHQFERRGTTETFFEFYTSRLVFVFSEYCAIEFGKGVLPILFSAKIQ